MKKALANKPGKKAAMHQADTRFLTRSFILLRLAVLALVLAACAAQPTTVARQPEISTPTSTIIPPISTLTPTAPPTDTPSPTPSPTASATSTPEPTATSTVTPTPTATPTATPRPDAGWEKIPGPSLLLPTLWAVNYGKDTISVADGVLTVHAAKGNWFTYENPATAIRVKDSFVVDLKMDGTGHYGVIFYGKSASGSEWWQGLRRFDIGFDGDKYPVIEYRDGASSAGQRWALKRLDPAGMTIIFSPMGAAFDVLDSAGNTLLRAPAPVTLAQPLFPDGLMWLGANADGGFKGGSSLTVWRLEVRSAKGQTAWKAVPAAPVASAPVVPAQKPAEAQPLPTGRHEIALKPGENPLALGPEQFRLNATTHNQRQFVQLRFPEAPVGSGDSEQQVSEFLSGPQVQEVWIENSQVFVSFSFRGKNFTGRFIVLELRYKKLLLSWIKLPYHRA